MVSDLHGAQDRLTKALPDGATLLLLGDLVNLIDYISKTGILYDVFSAEAVDKVSVLRAQGDYESAREVIRARAEGRDDEIRSEIGRRVAEQYESVFAALPDPTYLILGNVD
ncbi:MAG: hypothetical protein QOF16_430, partial [Actinomycetota bacterium]|nr:hypothetical protein [Actinomycetota bacterium]